MRPYEYREKEIYVYTQMNEHWFRAKQHKHTPLVSCPLFPVLFQEKRTWKMLFYIDTRSTVKKRQLTLSKVHI